MRQDGQTARGKGYPRGSWGTEAREYHVCVEVPVARVWATRSWPGE
ncbi:MAG: hypothetical protein ACRDYA_17690 [Egibacteraceae bacterium]